MKPTTEGPRIYVACLAAYNAGELHGEWIDAAQDVQEIRDEIEAMLRASPVHCLDDDVGDWAIHDFENFGGLELHEFENLEHVARAAELIVEHGEKAALIIDHYGGLDELDDAEEALRERYAGSYDDREAWVEEMLEDTGALQEVPELLRPYLDLERYARDLELSGDFLVFERGQNGGQGIDVFWSH